MTNAEALLNSIEDALRGSDTRKEWRSEAHSLIVRALAAARTVLSTTPPVQAPTAEDREKAIEIWRSAVAAAFYAINDWGGKGEACRIIAQALADREAAARKNAIEATIERCADYLKRNLSPELYADIADELRASARQP